MDRVTLIESFGELCSLWRYRCPVDAIGSELAKEGSRYSPEFDVGGVSWRLHFQHRSDPKSNETNLAIHLQCCSSSGGYAQFRISVCNRDPALSKSKTFHCHFRKLGSAWGLHHFIPLNTLLAAEGGYIDDPSGGSRSRASAGIVRFVVFDVMIQVLEPGPDGAYVMGTLPQPSYAQPAISSAQSRPRYENATAASQGMTSVSRGGSQMRPSSALPPPPPQQGTTVAAAPAAPVVDQLSQSHVRATLMYPFEHLEALCDMSFDVQGVRINAHRCVIAARMQPLLPKDALPLQDGAVVALQVSLEVFSTFLSYVYTEEYPEAGVLSAESLLDLYLLAAPCEFYALCGVCLKLTRPLIHAGNILPLVLSRYVSTDETLTAMYLRVLLDHYDTLITDKQFEEIPGHLFRRLSLILRDKERLPSIVIPSMKLTLGQQLAVLAESGDYADLELPLPNGTTWKAHKFLLASRSVVFSQAFHPSRITPPPPPGSSTTTNGSMVSTATVPQLPSLTAAELHFSQRAWTKGLQHIYRRHIEPSRDVTPEDIAFLFKLSSVLVMDGQLKREADACVTSANALRVLVFAVKHNASDLAERALRMVTGQFDALARQDPGVWDVISDLPQPSVVSLFRMVTIGEGSLSSAHA